MSFFHPDREHERRIEEELERENDLGKRGILLLELILGRLDRLLLTLEPDNRIAGFVITQQSEHTMAILGIVPGATGTFTLTPVNKAGLPVALPIATVPIWTSSDTTNAPVVAAADGLSATVTVPQFTPTTGQTFDLTASQPDGTLPVTATVPFDAAAADNTVAGFQLNQTS